MNKKGLTDHKLKHMINNNYVVVLKRGKDSSNLIMDKKDYVNKFEEIIKDGIRKGVYETTVDIVKDDLMKFQSFFHRNIK